MSEMMNKKDSRPDIPHNWTWESIEKIATVNPKFENKDSYQEQLEVQFIPMKLVEEKINKIYLTEKKYLKDVKKGSYSAFINGDILFAKVTPCMENGKIAITYNLQNGIGYGSSEFHVLRCNERILNKFLFYFLVQDLFRNKAQNAMTGAVGLRRVPKQFLENSEIPLPPISVQQAIVSKIEELFSELDKGIEQLKTAQQQLKTYRQAVLKWAFEEKLSNENIKGGKLPSGWNKVYIKDIAETYGGYAFKSGEFVANGKYQVLRMGNVRPGLLRLEENPVYIDSVDVNVVNRSLLQINDIVITQTGTRQKRDYGYTALISKKGLLLNQRIAAIRFNEQYLPKLFLYYSWTDEFKNQFFANETGNVGQGNVGIRGITEALIPICNIQEQQKIIEGIESRFSIADKLEESINQSLQQAEILRQSILKKAFEGKLIPSEAIAAIRPAAKVIPIERKVLAGKIINLLHKDRNFGLTKFQKTLSLVENFIQVPYETSFIRDTAGPYDNEFTTAFRKEMQEKDWVKEEPKKSITRLLPGNNLDQLIKDYTDYFKEKEQQIAFVIDQLKDKNTHESELIATLYAVWNNRLIKKQPVKINLLIEDFFNWSPKKKEEFQEEEIVDTYNWMKKVKLVPSGFGKAIE